MKANSKKQTKRTKAAVQVKDLAVKKNPKAGRDGRKYKILVAPL